MRLERRATALQLVLLAVLVAGCGMRIGGPNYGDTVDGIACDNGSNVTFVATVHSGSSAGASAWSRPRA